MSRALLALLAVAAEAGADTDGRRVRPAPLAVEASAAAAAGAGWIAVAWAGEARPSCPCDAAEVNAVDRPAVQLDVGGAELAAHATLAAALALPLAGLAATSSDAGAFARDALIVAQSALAAGLLTQSVKVAVSRPYPYMRGPAPYPEQNGDPTNYESFWSGHTAVPMAAAASFAWITARRHPRSPWRWAAWIAGPALALAAGGLQLAAGNHYPTDVAAGAAAGAAIGAANGWLHF